VAQIVCRYRKGEEVKWLSHLDLKRTLERAMRRAELPLALTEGHNPHPKVSLGPPLSVGATGEAEVFAVHLSAPMRPETVKERLNAQLPPGLQVLEAWVVPGYRRKETFGDLDIAEYRVTMGDGADIEALRARIAHLMASRELTVQRRREHGVRPVDLRPLIVSLEATQAGAGQIELRMRLRTGSHGGARPQEVVELLGGEQEASPVRYQRLGLQASARAARPAVEARRRWAKPRARGEKK